MNVIELPKNIIRDNLLIMGYDNVIIKGTYKSIEEYEKNHTPQFRDMIYVSGNMYLCDGKHWIKILPEEEQINEPEF